jgi:hypothetical protein
MNLSPSRLLLLLALGGVALPLCAQQTVINSKLSDVTADKANSFLGDPKHQINAGDYNAPRQLFNDYSQSLPMPRPLFLNNNNRDPSVQDALNKRKNWPLLTPEQIYGIQTPEEVLGVHNNSSDEKKLSLEEQFLLRESRATAGLATNGRTRAISWRDDANPFDKTKDGENPFSSPDYSQPDQQMQAGSRRSLNQLFNSKGSAGFSNDENKQESAWTSVFAQPDQPKPTPGQIADLERFRAMLEPNSAPDKLVTPTRFSAALAPAPDPYLQPQPKFNPAGRSYTSLENEAARPTGINPLPGITGPAPKPSTKKPSWEAQLPPWLSEGPQAHNQNRNF